MEEKAVYQIQQTTCTRQNAKSGQEVSAKMDEKMSKA